MLSSIQCDEERPRCSNCARYDSECVYAPATEPRTLTHTPESGGERTPSTDRDELPLQELELLHQWTIGTHAGFDDDLEVWRVDVPRLGLRFPFLFRGIMAVSALELACRAPGAGLRVHYIHLAAHHQDRGLPEYRAALHGVTEENVTALLAYSLLTTMYSAVATATAGDIFNNTSALEWFMLHRGVSDWPLMWPEWLASGPLHSHFRRWHMAPVDPGLNPDDWRLQKLQVQLVKTGGELAASERAHYEAAVRWLRQAFALTFAAPGRALAPKDAVFFWVEHVDAGFVELLARQQPRAVALMLFACVLVKRAQESAFMAGLADSMVRELVPCLDGRDVFLEWVDWPCRVVGGLE